MSFSDNMPTPCIEGIIDHHTPRKALVVILELARETERNCDQTRTLRGKVETVRIRTAHDNGKVQQGLIGELVLLQEHIKAAQFAIVR